MKLIGMLLIVGGAAGAALTFMNILNVSGPMGTPTPWAGIAIVGAVVVMLFRRPSN